MSNTPEPLAAPFWDLARYSSICCVDPYFLRIKKSDYNHIHDKYKMKSSILRSKANKIKTSESREIHNSKGESLARRSFPHVG